jgi:cephalosporin hydroxylase
VTADGIMEDLLDVPGGKVDWTQDNPKAAVHQFPASHPKFEVDLEPSRLRVTYWLSAYIKKK